MGQATVELPDPIKSPAAPAAPSADDLLSQLAGDEIDRLLSEANADLLTPPAEGSGAPARPSPSIPVAAPELQAPKIQAGALAADVPKVESPVTAAAIEPTSAAAVLAEEPTLPAAAPLPTFDPLAESEANLDAQLSNLFEQLNNPDGSVVEEEEEAEEESEEEAEAEKTQEPAAQGRLAKDAAALDEVTAAEAKALDDEIAGPATERTEASQSPVELEADAAEAFDVQADRDAPLPIYLRPLLWLSLPLANCPQGVRDAIGKVALLTLFNATAVLIYVLIFRRH